MKMRIQVLFVVLLLLTTVVASAADKFTVYTVNYPLAYFAERIGGEKIEVVFPVPPDVDPAFWEPTANDIAGFQQADLILLNGAGYAKWVKRASLPHRKLVNTSVAFQDDYINVTATVTHQHGPGGEHSHTGTAFTTWLDFNQSTQQAKAVLDALVKNYSQQANVFRRNYVLLETELENLDNQVMKLVQQDAGRLFIASHPVYQYFKRRYRIKLQSVMWEPDLVPTEHQWQELKQQLRKHPAEWMIWEDIPNEQTVERLRKIGIESLVFNPSANVPRKGDFVSVMQNNFDELEKAYR